MISSSLLSMNTDNGIVKLCGRLCLEVSISDTGKKFTLNMYM